MREALRLLEERDQLHDIRLEALRRKIDEAALELDRGEGIELDEAGLKSFLEDVGRRGRERLASEKGDVRE